MNIGSGENCPNSIIESFLKVISKKWMLQIIYDLFFNKKYFNEFKENKPDLDNKTLSLRLKELQEYGFVEKRINENRSEYYLTNKGKSLNKIIYELSSFAIENNYEFSDEKKDNIDSALKDYLDLN